MSAGISPTSSTILMLHTVIIMNDCVRLAQGSDAPLFGKWLRLKAAHCVRRLSNRIEQTGRNKKGKSGKAERRPKTRKRSSGTGAGGATRAGLPRPSSISDVLAEETKTESKCEALAALADC